MEWSLDRLLAPLTVEAFLQEYWEKKPLRIQREDEGFYRTLLSVSSVDELISSGGLQYPGLRLIKDGTELPKGLYASDYPWGNSAFTGVIAANKVFEQYASGATIVLQALHRRWRPLGELTSHIDQQLNFKAQTNVYFTPRGSQGFAPHFDTHEVFVLQVDGTKVWRLYDSPIELPNAKTGQKERAKDANLIEEFVVRPGDLLYMPRGFVHEALTTDDFSLHITLGITTTTWADLIEAAVARLRGSSAFRKSLPVGFASDPSIGSAVCQEAHAMLEAAMGELDTQGALDELIETFVGKARIPQTEQLRSLDLCRDLDESALVGVRPGLVKRISRTEDAVDVRFGDKTISFPAFARETVEHLLDVERVRVHDLRGPLDSPSKAVVVRRLVREGAVLVHQLGSAATE